MLNFAFNTSKQETVDHTNTDMLIQEFLSVTKPSRRREVKKRLDALTKYDDSEFRARFRLSKLTVPQSTVGDMSHSSSAVSFATLYDPIR